MTVYVFALYARAQDKKRSVIETVIGTISATRERVKSTISATREN